MNNAMEVWLDTAHVKMTSNVVVDDRRPPTQHVLNIPVNNYLYLTCRHNRWNSTASSCLAGLLASRYYLLLLRSVDGGGGGGRRRWVVDYLWWYE